MCFRGPEGLIELEEDLGVCSHGELLNRFLLPIWEFWREVDSAMLQDTQRECSNRIFCFYTAAILVVNCNTMVRVRDIRDLGVQVKAGVIVTEESRGKTLDNDIESALVNNEVIVVAEIIEGQVVAGTAENK